MNSNQVFNEICTIIARTLREQGHEVPTITEDTCLVGDQAISIDSLDLAVIVTELESVFSKDPFQDGFIDFRTIAELAKLYE